jgi:hypothetical protein
MDMAMQGGSGSASTVKRMSHGIVPTMNSWHWRPARQQKGLAVRPPRLTERRRTLLEKTSGVASDSQSVWCADCSVTFSGNFTGG